MISVLETRKGKNHERSQTKFVPKQAKIGSVSQQKNFQTSGEIKMNLDVDRINNTSRFHTLEQSTQ
jgi:hypothetical protein